MNNVENDKSVKNIKPTIGDVNLDIMEALIRESSISMISSGIAVPFISVPDEKDEEKKQKE